MAEEKVKIIIKKRGHIPGVGNGPILKPTSINKSRYESLKKLGYPIELVSTPTSSIINNIPQIKSEVKPLNEIKVTNKEEPKVSTPVEEKTIEEIIENEEDIIDESTSSVDDDVEETTSILTDDPNLAPEAYYNRDFLTSKNICKKILDAREVQYDSSASASFLRKLVLDSNPEIDNNED
jgi:hypothetical protein